MRKSIRFKLFTYMFAVIILFAALLYTFNTFFAVKYYINHKKKVLRETSKEIEIYLEAFIQEHNSTDYTEYFKETDFLRYLSSLEKKLGGTIVIGKENERIYYPTDRHNGMIASLIYYDNKSPQREKLEKKDGEFVLMKDPDYEINTLRYQLKIEDELMLAIWVPMAEISENADLSNRFTLIIGCITIFLTVGFTLIISNRFTKPIREMKEITSRLSKLDFTNTLPVNSPDELGELSRNINEMSDSLKEAILTLEETNKRLIMDISRERYMEKLRREFFANVSHELKTPIFLIQGYAEGLIANIVDSKEQKDFYCQVIMEETTKMDRLIKELLDLSRLEQGCFLIEKEHFELSLVLVELLKKYEKVFEEKGLELVTDITDGVMVLADKAKSEQVINNYIMNALKYTDVQKEIEISLTEDSEKAIFKIYNSCPFIQEEDLNKLWESFYKLNRARTRDDNGTGLGLSIVRAIQEAQQFSYGVSNYKKGVLFWCDFLKQ